MMNKTEVLAQRFISRVERGENYLKKQNWPESFDNALDNHKYVRAGLMAAGVVFHAVPLLTSALIFDRHYRHSPKLQQEYPVNNGENDFVPDAIYDVARSIATKAKK